MPWQFFILQKRIQNVRIWSLHCSDCGACWVLGCHALQSDRYYWNLKGIYCFHLQGRGINQAVCYLLLASFVFRPWNWRQYVLLKCQRISVKIWCHLLQDNVLHRMTSLWNECGGSPPAWMISIGILPEPGKLTPLKLFNSNLSLQEISVQHSCSCLLFQVHSFCPSDVPNLFLKFPLLSLLSLLGYPYLLGFGSVTPLSSVRDCLFGTIQLYFKSNDVACHGDKIHLCSSLMTLLEWI